MNASTSNGNTRKRSQARINNKDKHQERITFLSGDSCRYTVVRTAALKKKWRSIPSSHHDSSSPSSSSSIKPNNCNIIWVDTSNIPEYFNVIKPWQCINHFPGMINIARKTRLARNLQLMKRKFPREYSFHPRTFVLPQDRNAFRELFGGRDRIKKTLIVKPDGGCQGRGIFLTRTLADVDPMSSCVAQFYIRNPLLIEDKKFDLRIYVLVTCCDPLRVYLFRDGLVRLCTEDFVRPNAKNLDEKCMHLTNYAINKRSNKFVSENEDEMGTRGSKRSIQWLLEWLRQKHGDLKVERLWRKIGHICVKTIISILPILQREYKAIFGAATTTTGDETSSCTPKRREKVTGTNDDELDAEHIVTTIQNDAEAKNTQAATIEKTSKENVKPGNKCRADSSRAGEGAFQESDNNSPFEENLTGSRCTQILGFDIMLDTKLKPYLIEVNHLPSYGTDSSLDLEIKSQVVESTLSVMKAKIGDRQCFERREKERCTQRLWGKNKKHDVNEAKSTSNAGGGVGVGASIRELSRRSIPGAKTHTVVNNGDSEQKDKSTENEDLVKRVEEEIQSIYTAHAPHKIDKIPLLLQKYKGSESWVLTQLKKKYNCTDNNIVNKYSSCILEDKIDSGAKNTNTLCKDQNDNQSHSSSDADDNDDDDNTCPLHENHSDKTNRVDIVTEEEDRILANRFDRIFPTKTKSKSEPNFESLTNYICEQDYKRQRRLTCPLHVLRSDDNGAATTESSFPTAAKEDRSSTDNVSGGTFNSSHRNSDSWIDGNVHLRRSSDPCPSAVATAQPTQKQIDAADRLYRGFSVEVLRSSTNATTTTSAGKAAGANNITSPTVINPAWKLSDRVYRAREDGRSLRRQHEMRLEMRRSTTGAAAAAQGGGGSVVSIKPVTFDFGGGDGRFLGFGAVAPTTAAAAGRGMVGAQGGLEGYHFLRNYHGRGFHEL